MSSFYERNDPKRKAAKKVQEKHKKMQPSGFPKREMSSFGQNERPKPSSHPRNSPQKSKDSQDGFLWGVHAVVSALENSGRHGPIKLFLTPDRAESIDQALLKRQDIRLSVLQSTDITRMLPQGAVHQGMALQAPILEGTDLETLFEKGDGVILMLDQVTDPQNIGAIFRSCAAFGVNGLILQDRHSPPMQGVLAKTAAGAVDKVDFVRVTNLSRALEALNNEGYVAIGLDGAADNHLHEVLDSHQPKRVVLVMGSEGDGMRRLVSEHCEYLAKIPMPGGFESLNVSHATAIALYEARGRRNS